MGRTGEYFKEFTDTDRGVSEILLRKGLRRILGIGALTAAVPAFAGAAIEIVLAVGFLAAFGAGSMSARFIFRGGSSATRNAAPEGGRLVYKNGKLVSE